MFSKLTEKHEFIHLEMFYETTIVKVIYEAGKLIICYIVKTLCF